MPDRDMTRSALGDGLSVVSRPPIQRSAPLEPATGTYEVEAELRMCLDAVDEKFFRLRAMRDAEGRIVDFEYLYANRAALAVLDRRSEDVLGRRVLELLPSRRTNGIFDAYVQVTETGEPLRYETTFEQGGVTRDFEVIVSGTSDGCVAAGYDISERKRLERELTTLTAQLQTALTTRVVVEQAKGYIARARGVDVDAAFHLLRRHSRDHNRKIHELCCAVLAGEVPALAGDAGP